MRRGEPLLRPQNEEYIEDMAQNIPVTHLEQTTKWKISVTKKESKKLAQKVKKLKNLQIFKDIKPIDSLE